MKTLIQISVILFLISCTNTNNPKKNSSQVGIDTAKVDTFSSNNSLKTIPNWNHLRVLVLPPFDEIANAGISPDIQKYLESEIIKDTNLILIKFPLRQLDECSVSAGI